MHINDLMNKTPAARTISTVLGAGVLRPTVKYSASRALLFGANEVITNKDWNRVCTMFSYQERKSQKKLHYSFFDRLISSVD